MATQTTLITLKEYRERYENEHGVEYWFGEVVRKSMVSWNHGILAMILGQFFTELGYVSGTEIDLRVDPNWEPRPDVMAMLSPDLSERYPTKPVAIVAEILSPTDSMTHVFEKCGHYARVGVEQIFVFDPEGKKAWQWNKHTEALEPLNEVHLTNDSVLVVAEVWVEMKRRTGQAHQKQFSGE